jgi:hypothetical protein
MLAARAPLGAAPRSALALVPRSPQKLSLLVLAHLLAPLLDDAAHGSPSCRTRIPNRQKLPPDGVFRGCRVTVHSTAQRWRVPFSEALQRGMGSRSTQQSQLWRRGATDYDRDRAVVGTRVGQKSGSLPAIPARIILIFLGLSIDDSEKTVLRSSARVALVPRKSVRNGGRLPSSRANRSPIGGKST